MVHALSAEHLFSFLCLVQLQHIVGVMVGAEGDLEGIGVGAIDG